MTQKRVYLHHNNNIEMAGKMIITFQGMKIVVIEKKIMKANEFDFDD